MWLKSIWFEFKAIHHSDFVSTIFWVALFIKLTLSQKISVNETKEQNIKSVRYQSNVYILADQSTGMMPDINISNAVNYKCLRTNINTWNA